MTRVYDSEGIDRWAGSISFSKPIMAYISPTTGTTADTDTVVTVTGSNFVPSSVIEMDDVPQSTTYDSSTQLRFTIPTATFAAGASTKTIKVRTPAPGGGLTTGASFTISNAYTEFRVVMIDGNTGTGQHETAYSTNGTSWTSGGKTPTGGSGAGFDYVTYSSELGRLHGGWAGKFMYSDDDGVTWATGGTLGGLNWEMAAWASGFNTDGGMYIAGSSNGGIAYSSTGLSGSWTNGTPGSGIYTGLTSGLRIHRGIAYSRSLDILIGVGYQGVNTVGAIVKATDYNSWSEIGIAYADQMLGVDWIPQLGKFFVHCQNGDILWSSNGTTFNTVSSAVTSGGGLTSFAYSEALGVLVMVDQVNGIWSSTDEGLTWTNRSGTYLPRNVVYSEMGEQFLAPSQNSGTVFTSSNGTTWAETDDGLAVSASWIWATVLDDSPS